MALPEQIRKQSAAIQDLYKDMNSEGEGETPPDEGATPPPTETPAPNAEASESDTSSANGNATQPPAPEPTPQGGSEDNETLLQRYRTLQGMFNAEVPRLQSETRRQAGRIQQLEQLLASMSTQGQQSQQSAQRPPAEKKEFVTPQDIDDYGDSIDMMRRVTQEGVYELQHRIAQLEQTVQQLSNLAPQVKAVAQKQAMTAEQAFWAELSRQVPNWQEINNNKQFTDWLMEVDPMTGFTTQTFLDDAQNNLDAGRVASIFRAWEKKNTGGATSAQTTTNSANSELGKQVAPGKGKAGGPPPSNVGKQYSTADIQKFYDDVRKGLYKDRPEERARMEADIFAAQRDGRLIVS